MWKFVQNITGFETRFKNRAVFINSLLDVFGVFIGGSFKENFQSFEGSQQVELRGVLEGILSKFLFFENSLIRCFEERF